LVQYSLENSPEVTVLTSVAK